MAAKKKAITVLSADKVGVGNLGASAVVKLTNIGLPPARPTGKVLRGEPAAMVKELVSLLRNEAKVI
jgi:electron transfer flavoprotein beta subunit